MHDRSLLSARASWPLVAGLNTTAVAAGAAAAGGVAIAAAALAMIMYKRHRATPDDGLGKGVQAAAAPGPSAGPPGAAAGGTAAGWYSQPGHPQHHQPSPGPAPHQQQYYAASDPAMPPYTPSSAYSGYSGQQAHPAEGPMERCQHQPLRQGQLLASLLGCSRACTHRSQLGPHACRVHRSLQWMLGRHAATP